MITPVEDLSQIAVARRTATEFARRCGFDEHAAARVALVATEMASNLLKHAGRGHLVIDTFADGESAGMELLSLDRGPGIGDIPRATHDGVSTAGSPGTGLGAMRRQSDQLAIWSRPGFGTGVVARFCMNPAPSKLSVGAIVAPYPGEPVCGDTWRFAVTKAGPRLLMVDGSGHGWHASQAAEAAAKAFSDNPGLDPVKQMEAIHRALAPTRGAAAAIACLDRTENLVRFVGIGNIAGAVVAQGAMKRMVSQPGTAGHIVRKITSFNYPCEGEASIILHSDGLSAKWDLDDYPGLSTSHPSLIAGILFRDHRRGKDDASIAVMRVTS
jgi:anti-sigma regulatory factor (Ser/Thr protein kinase)